MATQATFRLEYPSPETSETPRRRVSGPVKNQPLLYPTRRWPGVSNPVLGVSYTSTGLVTLLAWAPITCHLEWGVRKVQGVGELGDIELLLGVQPLKERLEHGTDPDAVVVEVSLGVATNVEESPLPSLEIENPEMEPGPSADTQKWPVARSAFDHGFAIPFRIRMAKKELPPIHAVVRNLDDLGNHYRHPSKIYPRNGRGISA